MVDLMEFDSDQTLAPTTAPMMVRSMVPMRARRMVPMTAPTMVRSMVPMRARMMAPQRVPTKI